MSFSSIRKPSSITWSLEHNTLTHTSPLSKVQHSIYFHGTRWRVSLSYRNLTRDEANAISVFIQSLRGTAGRFPFTPLQQVAVTGVPRTDPVYLAPLPHIDYQSGYSGDYADYISGNQMPVGADAMLFFFNAHNADDFQIPAGYFFKVNGELKRTIAVAKTDGKHNNDAVPVSFTPPLRAAIPLRVSPQPAKYFADLYTPSGTFRLVSDEAGAVQYRAGGRVADINVDLIEVI